MSIPARIQGFLDDNKVPYHVLTHHQTYTALEIAAALHVPGKELAKTVIVKAGNAFAMVVLPATSKVDLVALARAMSVPQVELAHEGEMRALFPDCEVGAEPPFGNLYSLSVYVDAALAEDREIVFEAGNHQEAIKVSYADFERLVHPQHASLRIAH